MGTVVCLPENLAKICGESGQWLVIGGSGRRGPPGRPVPDRKEEDEPVRRKQPRCTVVVFDRNGAETALAGDGCEPREESLRPFFGRALMPAVAPASAVVGRILDSSNKVNERRRRVVSAEFGNDRNDTCATLAPRV
ncbi:UNVERIFIED_CONTAM: hypothetical protein PYX00_006550 [Menopon gallinae]|uniref:Uncharacterized protein n=1 Tax=Menopon gallinae TaxID=328185 RepID=A0AAW2HWA7_9NEOP